MPEAPKGDPFQKGSVVNLNDGEIVKDCTLVTVPQDKRFIIEFVGVNGFAQLGQRLFVAIQATTNGYKGAYPIVLAGRSRIEDPAFPMRRFGSQQVRLYADPGSDLIVTVARHLGRDDARVFVDVCGLLMNLP